MSNYQLVKEASLGRLLGKYFDIGFIIISAERSCSAEKGQSCSEDEELEQAKLNKQNERRIRDDIREAGFGFVPAFGGFRELVVDPDSGEETFKDNPNPEPSFVIPLKDGKAVDDLRELGMNLCQKYNQDSFLFKPPASQDDRAYFVDRSGNPEMTFGNVTVADMSQVYFTYLRKNQPSRRFSMTADGGGEAGDQELQEAFRMYIPRSPSTFGEAKQRYGEIFIRIKKQRNK
jgi:hypothetical protein